MGPDAIRKSALTRTLADVLGDLSELMRTELRLARAELTEKLTSVVSAVAWMGVAGVLWILTAMLAVEALVFGIASFGLALHWSCLVVAAALAVLGLVAFAFGRSAVHGDVLPTRSIRQINESIKTAKEQLT
jgi:uncharacterized membrane protein YqjE